MRHDARQGRHYGNNTVSKYMLTDFVRGMHDTLYVYCWAADDHVYIGEESETKHGALVLGQPVKCAGTVRKKEGTIVMVSNDSGHYQPTREDVTTFCSAANVRLNTMKICWEK